MNDKQTVLDAVNRLPETTTLDEIRDELRIMRSVKKGREDIAAGRTRSHEEVTGLVESWAKEWTPK